MRSAVALLRRSPVGGAVAAAVLAACALSPAALAAGNPGGTGAPAGTPSTSTSGGSVPTKPAAPTKPSLPRITSAACTPAAHCSTNPRQVSLHGTLLIAGVGLRAGMIVAFPSAPGARISRASPAARLRTTSRGLVVTVPSSAHSGKIIVWLSSSRHTGVWGPITVFAHALHPPAKPAPAPRTPVSYGTTGTALDGQGMWIWYVSASEGGSLPAIIAKAKAEGVGTVYVKSSDATNWWSQFSPELVAALHAAGIKVCAWQYVYGTNPAGEAEMGAKAAATGADCLMIDAESEYEGKYASAQTYIDKLREKVGPSYPIALASFPYVYYHTALPYSVFMGPGGAQYDAPQMYWKDIGQSVDTVYANTYISNRIYGRPIFPLGQTYSSPSSADIVRFREEAALYGATGYSWWDWQETSAREWAALAAPLSALTTVTPDPSYTELSKGNKGDPVLWMQEHLATAIPAQATTGNFDAATQANLEAFQTAHGIPASGVTDTATWQALLALAPVPVNWTGGGPKG